MILHGKSLWQVRVSRCWGWVDVHVLAGVLFRSLLAPGSARTDRGGASIGEAHCFS